MYQNAKYANTKGREIQAFVIQCCGGALLCNARCMLKKDIQSIILSGQRTGDSHTNTWECVFVGNGVKWFSFLVLRMSSAWWHTHKLTQATSWHMCNRGILRKKESIWWKKGHEFHHFHILWENEKCSHQTHTTDTLTCTFVESQAHITRLRNIPIFTHCFHPKIQKFACFANASAHLFAHTSSCHN